jgi:hypothetical protein
MFPIAQIDGGLDIKGLRAAVYPRFQPHAACAAGFGNFD